MSDQPLRLTAAERAELEARVRSRAGRAHDAKVARTVLLLADRLSYREIAERVGCSEPFISKCVVLQNIPTFSGSWSSYTLPGLRGLL